MELSSAERSRIHLLSDHTLYPAAVKFIATYGTVEGQKQMVGLLQYAHSPELIRFVKHQAERDWSGNKTHYQQFYQSLKSYLDELRRQIKNEFDLIPQNLTKAETNRRVEMFFELLAPEFIQHLAAENLWQEKVQ